MSLKLYDEGFLRKIKNAYSNVEMSHPEEFPETPKFPIVLIYRIEQNPLIDELNFASKNTGFITIDADGVRRRLLKMEFSLMYQIDVVGDEREAVDTLYTELVMFLVRFPEIRARFPYNDAGEIVVDTRIDSVVNNSDISNEENLGRLYRYTITVEVPNALICLERGTYMDGLPPSELVAVDYEGGR